MKCPVCEKSLSSVHVDPVTVDICRDGCGGIWFDNFELGKVEEVHEKGGEELLALIPSRPAHPPKSEEKHLCPKCEKLPMQRRLFSPKDTTEIDQCPGCNGIWLDFSELAALRARFATSSEREAATQQFLKDHFDQQFASLRAAHEEERQALDGIAKALRFLCPSYYIPGKQNWGGY